MTAAGFMATMEIQDLGQQRETTRLPRETMATTSPQVLIGHSKDGWTEQGSG